MRKTVNKFQINLRGFVVNVNANKHELKTWQYLLKINYVKSGLVVSQKLN